MANISWIGHRLLAMSIPEIFWRLSIRWICFREERIFGKNKISVCDHVFNPQLSDLQPCAQKMHLNLQNKSFKLNTTIHLLAGADYEKFKKCWNAGFQTEQTWPDQFSYKLVYKQRDDIGDARTNWELNRHFQLALLAKDYYASKDEIFLNEFKEIFYDWNSNNSFLHGISWTSVMEVAIRCSNWCYAYAFLEDCGLKNRLLEDIRIGIINMTDYICCHYSRYSSANNHLIIEALSIGQAGILFGYSKWIDLAIDILTKELPRQNYSDGINKEASLHYQSFYMEAMGLMMRLMIKNGISVPYIWIDMLEKMSRYLSECMGDYGEVIVFGDDDEGKILDLQGGTINHYKYVLSMMSLLLNERYIELSNNETLRWLFDDEEFIKSSQKTCFVKQQYSCYRDGGYTILRSKDNKVLMGIDHSDLGFGSIAAHGHADALSFQLFYEGIPIFVDPGTYIYHCDIQSRNYFRQTRCHNTVSVNESNQSEMLGAFLWGKRAEAVVDYAGEKNGKYIIVMHHDGYSPIICKRTIIFDGKRDISIFDKLNDSSCASASFVINPEIVVSEEEKDLCLKIGKIKVILQTDNDHRIIDSCYSNSYGIMENTKTLYFSFNAECRVNIHIEEL